MKVQELIDDLLAVADPDTEIEWRVVGSAEETVEIWPTQRYYGGEIKTQVDIDAQGEINGVDATSDGKVRVEVWFKVLDFGFYNMDCMDGMKEFPDNYFDLAVVDPPYGDGKLSENSGGYWNRFGQRFDRYKQTPPTEECATTGRGMGLRALAERGRANTQKNHCVGRCPGRGVFSRALPRLTTPDHLGGQLLPAATDAVLPGLAQADDLGRFYNGDG